MDLENTTDTLQEAIIWFADFEHCREFMVELRWPDGVVKCPQCGSETVTWLSKTRVWKCYAKHPRPTFTLKTGTIFEDSPIPLSKWLPAAWLIINCKNGISSYEIARDLAITQKSAWFMLHRIRLAMKEGSFEKFSGEVEADESFIGGKMANMRKHRQEKLRALGRSRGGVFGKAIVTGLLDRNTKKAGIKVASNVRQFGLRNIAENVEKGSTVYSDALKSYRNLGADGFVHEFIDHTETYVKGRIHTNGLENFWSLFKRALKGTYVSVEPFHLQAYADEQSFRYNNRKLTDPERFAIVMRQIVGRRLTYDELTGKTELQREMRPEGYEEAGARQAQARFGSLMKAAPFDSTPEFQHFKEVMRGVLAVPKKRLDELVRLAKENSPRIGDPHAPGQKRRKRRVSRSSIKPASKFDD